MSLSAFLSGSGYIQIPLSKNGMGHFQTNGLLNERAVSVLIDTGAANTVFSLAFVHDMKLPTTKLPIFGGGAGAAQLEIHEIQDARFGLVEMSPQIYAFLAMDLRHVNEALRLKGSTPIEAILGADVFENHSAVIDYSSNSLYLKV